MSAHTLEPVQQWTMVYERPPGNILNRRRAASPPGVGESASGLAHEQDESDDEKGAEGENSGMSMLTLLWLPWYYFNDEQMSPIAEPTSE